MSPSSNRDPQIILTVRAPRELVERVREIAQREFETDSTILRRLLRRGLEAEQRVGASR